MSKPLSHFLALCFCCACWRLWFILEKNQRAQSYPQDMPVCHHICWCNDTPTDHDIPPLLYMQWTGPTSQQWTGTTWEGHNNSLAWASFGCQHNSASRGTKMGRRRMGHNVGGTRRNWCIPHPKPRQIWKRALSEKGTFTPIVKGYSVHKGSTWHNLLSFLINLEKCVFPEKQWRSYRYVGGGYPQHWASGVGYVVQSIWPVCPPLRRDGSQMDCVGAWRGQLRSQGGSAGVGFCRPGWGRRIGQVHNGWEALLFSKSSGILHTQTPSWGLFFTSPTGEASTKHTA